MPALTRVYLKSALLYLVAALSVGLLTARSAWLPSPWLPAGLTPVYFHLLMVGWVTLLIIGMAHWMFPRYTREQPRGRVWLMWAAFGLLNAGLLLRVVAEPLHGLQPGPWPWGLLLAVAAVLQWAGGLAFVANVWPRVKER